jgi:hypothetical protein
MHMDSAVLDINGETDMSAKVQALKATLDQATEAYNVEQARLVAAGLNSKARYEALKPLKAAQDAANSAYVKAATNHVKRGLDAIIAADAPRRAAEKLARSPWKQAKAAAQAERNAQ